jgi:hypothetical protein
MKKYFLLFSLLVILILTSITFSSCKKKTTPIPDFPQLIGHWSGTTSQSAQIRFMIDNLSGYLYVTEYNLTVYTFNVNDLTLYGNFAVYEPGNTTDIITGTYSCSMGTKQITI